MLESGLPCNDTCHFDRREKSLTICFIIRFLVALLLEMTSKMVSDVVGIKGLYGKARQAASYICGG